MPMYGCPNASEATLKDTGKLPRIKPRQNVGSMQDSRFLDLYSQNGLTTKSREVSKPQDSGLNFSNRSEIWQTSR